MYAYYSLEKKILLLDLSGTKHHLNDESADISDKSSLLYCLTLSTNAKRFLIQREINRSKAGLSIFKAFCIFCYRRRKFVRNILEEPFWFSTCIGMGCNTYLLTLSFSQTLSKTMFLRVRFRSFDGNGHLNKLLVKIGRF